MDPSSEKMQKEFQALIAGRADQVLPLCIAFFLLFYFFQKLLCFEICKKIDPLPFCRQQFFFIMMYIEVLDLYFGRA